MGYWGKLIGGFAGFAVGGPFGAMIGAALGHAADSGAGEGFRLPFDQGGVFNPARVTAMLGGREQLFAMAVVVLSAKLAKVDGPVKREEIEAFKRLFRIPPAAMRDIGRLFDQARDSAGGYEAYADQLGDSFADNRGMLEEVLAALFAIARADGPINAAEQGFLARVARGFGIADRGWERAREGLPPGRGADEADPYAIIGVPSTASNEAVHAAWKKLMRENHPDTLAARGVPADFVAKASEKVARINAAWDRIKRDRRL
ncbi:TerB family tellurite resistance protein [Acidisphaera rubrifaciens]|uniref:Heat shock protein DnaJ-like protein DjlA n=1 Tax=Acidisphaera rubrifaciens HS-AP3 TaxID=1231350 RepID=A0A0D6P981_9PROT|nr:TerB family tellurite resistance protein [Acidisphaera rubrifaciens]GAN78320.1 heat shock protein DnaJ-like protein DjlA [Acidisphaera rubrifaciens HS-AP3]